MVAVPAATPDTMPDVPMVATPVLLLAHVPPLVVDDKVVVEPAHTEVVPVITAGSALTVYTAVPTQPPLTVYEMVVVPAAKVVTTPVPDTIVATLVLLLVHVPPLVGLLSVLPLPTHAANVPVMVGVVHGAVGSTLAHHVSHTLTVAALTSCIVQKSVLFTGSSIVAE